MQGSTCQRVSENFAKNSSAYIFGLNSHPILNSAALHVPSRSSRRKRKIKWNPIVRMTGGRVELRPVLSFGSGSSPNAGIFPSRNQAE